MECTACNCIGFCAKVYCIMKFLSVSHVHRCTCMVNGCILFSYRNMCFTHYYMSITITVCSYRYIVTFSLYFCLLTQMFLLSMQVIPCWLVLVRDIYWSTQSGLIMDCPIGRLTLHLSGLTNPSLRSQ